MLPTERLQEGQTKTVGGQHLVYTGDAWEPVDGYASAPAPAPVVSAPPPAPTLAPTPAPWEQGQTITDATDLTSNPVFMDSFRALFGGPPPPPPPAAYIPGQTLDQYLSLAKTAYVPQHYGATEDEVIGGGDSGTFIPGHPAGATTWDYYGDDTQKATNEYYKELYAKETPVTPIAPGWGLQNWVPRNAENGRETQSWEGWANLIGFKGPTTRPTGYEWINGEDTGTGSGWRATSEATPEFKKALANYGFRETHDNGGNTIVEMVDPNMNVVGRQRTNSGPSFLEQYLPVGLAVLAALVAPEIAGELLSLAGAEGASAAAMLAELPVAAGATTAATLSPTAAAIAAGAGSNYVQSVIKDKDFGDILESMASGAATSLASNYLTQNLTPLVSKNVSSFLYNLSPEDLTTAQSKYVDTATQAAGNVAGNVATNELKSVITGKPYDFEKDVVSQFVGQAYSAVAGDVAKKIGATPAQVSSIVQFGLDGDAAKLIKSVGLDLARGAIKQFNLNVLTNTNDSLVAAANDVTSRSTSAADFFEVPSNTVGGPNDPYLYPAPVTMADDNGANVQQAEVGQAVARDESTQPHIVGEDPIFTQLVSAGLLPEGMTQEQIDAVTAEIRAAEAMADGDTSAQTVEIAHRKIPGLTEGEQQSFQDFLDSVNTPVNLPPSPQRVEIIGTKPDPGLPDDNLDPDNLLGGTVIDTSSLEGSGPATTSTDTTTTTSGKTPSAPSAPVKPPSVPAKPPSAPAADKKPTAAPKPDEPLDWKLYNSGDALDLEKLFSPGLYAQHQAERRAKQSHKKMSAEEQQLMALLETLGYRS